MQKINPVRRIAWLLAILLLPSPGSAATRLVVSPSNPRQLSNSDVAGAKGSRTRKRAVIKVPAGFPTQVVTQQ